MEDGAQSARAESELSVAFDWHSFRLEEEDINVQCERYNGLCSVLHQAQELHEADDTRSKAVKQDVMELEQILKDAKNAINSKLQDLENDIQLFSSEIAARADPRWYRGVKDLTAFDGVTFMHVMRTMSILDIPDFANYLMEALPRAVKSPAPRYKSRSSTSFLSKAMVLIKKLLQSCGDDYSAAFPVLITMKTRVLPSRSLRNDRRTYDHERELDGIIETLLRHHDVQIKENPDLFWDFAAGFRQIFDHACKIRRKGKDIEHMMGLINAVRDKAIVEVRRRTMLVINGRLPAELADLLVEFAMLAEEVPRSPFTVSLDAGLY